MTIQLGQRVRDTVTGFEGIATARVEYMNGCVQFCVVPRCSSIDDSKMPSGEYIDHQRLEIVGRDALKVAASNTGGPQRDAPSVSYNG